MQRMKILFYLILILPFLILTPFTATAQEQEQEPESRLLLSARYPAQVVEIGETVNFDLTLRGKGISPQIVRLDLEDLPEGWTATFRGGGKVIQAVYVEPDSRADADLRLEPPKEVESGTYRFTVVARGEDVEARLPLEVTVKEKLPASLTFTVSLPTIKGTPSSTFRYSATLKNEGDEEISVNLEAEAPEGFRVVFKTSGQEVTNLPLSANSSKSISIEARPFMPLPIGTYPIKVRAEGGDVEASLDLTAEITGQPELSLATPDGRLSGKAYAGRESPLKIVIKNTGSAPARDVELSATEPSGWKVEFDPEQIPEIPANGQQEVTVKITPSEKAVAGDYMVTIRANAEDTGSESADFRITVLTSTLWGVVALVLIAASVAVVGLAVMRFGRR